MTPAKNPLLLITLAVVVGCGDARVQLSAADVLSAAAAQMRAALDEYHAALDDADERRESDAVAAFVTRLRTDINDDVRVDAHAGEFAAALKKVRDDRRVEWQRRQQADDNVALLLETAGGLRKLAVESLSLQDEVKRYLTDSLAARQAAKEVKTNGQ